MVISGSKIDKVAREMIIPFEKKKSKVKEKMELLLSKSVLKTLNKDIVDFFNKHPERIKRCDYIYFKTERKDKKGGDICTFLYAKAPQVDRDVILKLVDKKTSLGKSLDKLNFEYDQHSQDATIFSNKIKCTLSKLRTYAKIRDNFPEAYKILIEKIDKKETKKEEPKTSICDDVEKLRAELNQKSNK